MLIRCMSLASHLRAACEAGLVLTSSFASCRYCHYVAGLVGLGLSQLWSASQWERPDMAQQDGLSNHMGLFLQKTNIIRDYLEDISEVASPANLTSSSSRLAQLGLSGGDTWFAENLISCTHSST